MILFLFMIFNKICTSLVKIISSFLVFFTQLNVFCDELVKYSLIPVYNCSIPSSCGTINFVKKYHEKDYVICFIKGLNERFSHSKSHIIVMNSLSDIDKTFSLVIQQEHELLGSIFGSQVNEKLKFVSVLQVNSA